MTDIATRQGTAADEVPAFLDADGEQVFAVLTRPTTTANGVGVVILAGAAWVPAPGRNRQWTTIARRLAGHGYHVARFDYHGVGESTGAVDDWRLDRPFIADAIAVVEWVRSFGIEKVILLGTCFGSRTGLASAALLDDISGLAMFPPPVRDCQIGDGITSKPYRWWIGQLASPKARQGLRDAETRAGYALLVRRKLRRTFLRRAPSGKKLASTHRGSVSPLFVRELSGLVDRGVPTLILFGERDDFYEDFRKGLSGPLGKVLERAGTTVVVDSFDGVRIHGLSGLGTQQQVADYLVDWVLGVTASASS
jgi:pimeloyl-ACP methyl ester carboxylesterase